MSDGMQPYLETEQGGRLDGAFGGYLSQEEGIWARVHRGDDDPERWALSVKWPNGMVTVAYTDEAHVIQGQESDGDA
jgi:hypothetical protein